MNVNQFRDGETIRQNRNLTPLQQRNNAYTKEGVIVNSFYKDPAKKTDLQDTYDMLLISDDTRLPKKLMEKEIPVDKSLLPISGIVTGVMGSIALLTAFVRRNTKINLNISNMKKLPALTRNIAINEETHQALYQMIQAPNQKTILAGIGVLTLTAMAFMGKTFFDGFKDVWVKRREADIQKNLQENLIDVETQSFSGKMQIMRSMLAKHAIEFQKYLSDDKEKAQPDFGWKKYNPVSFTSNVNNKENNSKKNSVNYILLGLGTFASIIGLGFVSMRNLSKSKLHLDKYVKDTKAIIGDIIAKSTPETKDADKLSLKHLFRAIGADLDDIKSYTGKLKWDSDEVSKFEREVIEEVQTSTTKVNEAMGGDGTPKPSFYSHVNDYRAFFYNWLLDTSNPQFKQLFFGITALTAIGYGGKLVGDAVKDVQVKKINAETELQLQKRLVSTELRNFKSKKDAAIQPLVDEFYRQVDAGKSKEELKTMAENILFEIKNGAPFVYS